MTLLAVLVWDVGGTDPSLHFGGGSMATAEQAYFRPQLEQRRERLLSALHSSADASLSNLLSEVDAALARMDEGTFGICETCHDPVEKERLPVWPEVPAMDGPVGWAKSIRSTTPTQSGA